MFNLPIIIAVLLLAAGVFAFQRGLRESASEKVLERLDSSIGSDLPFSSDFIQRELLRSGIQLSFKQIMLLTASWCALLLISLFAGGWLMFLMVGISSLVVVRLYLIIRFRRRLQRMIEQLPQLLDHIVRSLKSGRTLGDGLLLAIEQSQAPLQGALLRVRNSVQRGMSLTDAVDDFASLYDQEEFHMLALSISVNQRYGGNASEVLENLITLIRERDHASRQLRALTGETRLSALVLGGLPLAMAAYMFFSSPDLLLGMWQQSSGQLVLLAAFALQVTGSFLLWRMMKSI